MVQIEAPETAYLNATTLHQRVALRLKNGIDREIDIFGGELRMARGKPGTEGGTGHADILARSTAPGYSAAGLPTTTNPELQSLPRPLHRKWRHEILQRQACRLFSRENGFHDV